MKMKDELYIGCHLSASRGFLAMGRDAVSIGANTFAFFTRNPRGGKSKAVDPGDAQALIDLMDEEGFGKLVAHAPYTLNPCSGNKNVRDFAGICMREDLEKMEFIPGNYYNLHPGSHVGQGAEEGIRMIAELLNESIRPGQQTVVLLETMSGKGSEVGRSFQEIAEIIDKVRLKDKVGVCMDTCHISDGGYDLINDFSGVLDEFDRVIGPEYLKAMHINDSMNSLGSHKDRHARIGEGEIGLDAIVEVLREPRISGLPCILETPNENLSGYAEEILMLRSCLADSRI